MATGMQLHFANAAILKKNVIVVSVWVSAVVMVFVKKVAPMLKLKFSREFKPGKV